MDKKLGVFHSDHEQFCWSILTQHSWNHVYLISICVIMCICIKLHVYIYNAYAHVWVKTECHVPLELDGFIVKLIGMSWPVAPKWPLGGVRDRQQWTVWCPILREFFGDTKKPKWGNPAELCQGHFVSFVSKKDGAENGLPNARIQSACPLCLPQTWSVLRLKMSLGVSVPARARDEE